MKKIFLILLLFPIALSAQIKNVIVETYYVADANDAADATYGTLVAGSKTYRVYIELEVGSKLRKIYGDSLHHLTVSSTANFFNNNDRPTAYFGYLINKSWYSSNPTIALDSWLTLGQAAKGYCGVLKTEDTDAISFIDKPGGLLENNDPEAGLPLYTADGLMVDTTVLAQPSDFGFKDNNNTGPDTTVFGSANPGSQFISNSAYILQTTGVTGINHKALVAQLTTEGDISFELNVEVEEPGVPNNKIVKYVAALANGEVSSDALKLSPFLKYPQECGCRDPRYNEYSASFACDDSTACKTPVAFGCMDTMACNYNPNANFSVPSLCCYPGYCNDRDLAVVCPSLVQQNGFIIYPNPAQDYITVKQSEQNSNTIPVHVAIYNSFGNIVLENIGQEKINISALHPGLYMVQLLKDGNVYESKTFMKN